MKSILAVAIVGLLLFGISAGVSWMMVFNAAEIPEEVESEDSDDGADVFPPLIDVANKADEMPVALRPDQPVTIEVVTELAHSIMKKDRAIKKAEKQLAKEEKRIQLLFEDLAREREELTALGESIDAKVKQAREAVELLKLEKEQLEKQITLHDKMDTKNGSSVADADQESIDRRVSRVKDWFRRLEPDAAAKQLKVIANRGELEFAAQIMGGLGERASAKVLEVFNDEPLMAEMIEAYIQDKGSSSSIESIKRR